MTGESSLCDLPRSYETSITFSNPIDCWVEIPDALGHISRTSLIELETLRSASAFPLFLKENPKWMLKLNYENKEKLSRK